MTAEQFAYWLQGFLELSGDDIGMTPAQVKMVREHLATVFTKVTPPLGAPGPYSGTGLPPTAPSLAVTCSELPRAEASWAPVDSRLSRASFC